MKIIKLLATFICLFAFQTAQAAHQLYADMDGINIPYGTKLNLAMAENVTTTLLSQGDMFQAYLVNDIYINNKLILPAKTVFRGRISEVKPSKRLSRPASLYLTLDHLVTKKGAQLPLDAGIASSFNYVLKNDGAITSNSNYFTTLRNDYKNAGQIVPRTVKWGSTAGDNLFTGARYVFVPVAALGGTIACVSSGAYSTIADLIKKGEEIIIPKGTEFDIMLLSTLEIPN